MPPKAPPEVEMPPPQPHDVPAGGLDAPPELPAVDESQENFPGESRLTPEERDRWLILHFALPRTIMTCDMAEGTSTEEELNDVLSRMAWGGIDKDTSEWVLQSEEPSMAPPHSSLISYREYVERLFPSDDSMDCQQARVENEKMALQKCSTFTNPGEPGVKFRPMFDQMVKNLQHSNKTLMKAYDLKKPVLNEADIPEDPSRSEAQNIMRYGRYQVLPGFWQLLNQLTKRNRRFSIVFRSFNEEQLAIVRRELHLFCQGQHPAYDGKNKTQKPPPMSGDKGSRDMRLIDAGIGHMDRACGLLSFAKRPFGDAPKIARPGEVAMAASTAPAGAGAPGDVAEADGVADTAAEVNPTEYNFSENFHEAYAGLQNQVLQGMNCAAILDDFKFWKNGGKAQECGKLLLVDHAGGPAETRIQHVLFDGSIAAAGSSAADVRDVVSGEALAAEQAEGLFTHQVNVFEATTDVDYFVRALDTCEVNFSQRILESRRVEGAAEEVKAEANKDKSLPPKEYLYRYVNPALLPALEACQRDRPEDPIEFIAFYMLRHSKQYSKTLKA